MRFKLKLSRFGINDVYLAVASDNPQFRELIEAVSTVLDQHFDVKGIPFKLSLNGKDELNAGDEAFLATDMGLVSGDIIRIIENVNLTDHVTPKMKTTQAVDAAITSTDNTKKLINRCMRKPILCHESTSRDIPDILQYLYEDTNVETCHDALVVALHVLMLECGFTTTDFQWDKVKGIGGVYRLNYIHPIDQTKACLITCVAIERKVAVHGTIRDQRDDSTFQTDFNTDTYCELPIVKNMKRDAMRVYKNLPQLSQTFKDELAHPILHALPCASLQRRSFAYCTLLHLPYECKMLLFSFLDYKSLHKVSLVCTNLREVANEPKFWKWFMYRHFAAQANAQMESCPHHKCEKVKNDCGICKIDWKFEYLKLERKRARNWAQVHSPFGYQAVPRTLLPPQRDFFFPGGGIIGGDYDMHPHLPSYPGYPRMEPRLPRQENPLIGPFRFRPSLRGQLPFGPRFPPYM